MSPECKLHTFYSKFWLCSLPVYCCRWHKKLKFRTITCFNQTAFSLLHFLKDYLKVSQTVVVAKETKEENCYRLLLLVIFFHRSFLLFSGAILCKKQRNERWVKKFAVVLNETERSLKRQLIERNRVKREMEEVVKVLKSHSLIDQRIRYEPMTQSITASYCRYIDVPLGVCSLMDCLFFDL